MSHMSYAKAFDALTTVSVLGYRHSPDPHGGSCQAWVGGARVIGCSSVCLKLKILGPVMREVIEGESPESL